MTHCRFYEKVVKVKDDVAAILILFRVRSSLFQVNQRGSLYIG